jgi:hypothetical protein
LKQLNTLYTKSLKLICSQGQLTAEASETQQSFESVTSATKEVDDINALQRTKYTVSSRDIPFLKCHGVSLRKSKK